MTAFDGISDNELSMLETEINEWLTAGSEVVIADSTARLAAKVIVSTAPAEAYESEAAVLVRSVANGVPFNRLALDSLLREFYSLSVVMGDDDMSVLIAALGQWNAAGSAADIESTRTFENEESVNDLNALLLELFGPESVISDYDESEYDDGGMSMYLEGDWDSFDDDDEW